MLTIYNNNICEMYQYDILFVLFVILFVLIKLLGTKINFCKTNDCGDQNDNRYYVRIILCFVRVKSHLNCSLLISIMIIIKM